MFTQRLLELEAEILAREQSLIDFAVLSPECAVLLGFIENQIGVELGNNVPINWKGWLSYKRGKDALIICRGRAFKLSGKYRAGLNIVYGADTISEYERGFDVAPPQDLDHLLLNFDDVESPQVFLWYGENLVPYRLIFTAVVAEDPHHQLSKAIEDACVWIINRPKNKTLIEFLREIENNQ